MSQSLQTATAEKIVFDNVVGVKASTTFVSGNYDAIERSVLRGLQVPRFDGATAAKIMQGIMDGRFQCWAIFGVRGEEENDELIGTVLTYICTDHFVGRRSLIIYSFHVYEHVALDAWVQAFTPLVEYAAANAVVEILAYTKVPRVVEIAEAVGFDAEWRQLRLVIPAKEG